MRSASTAVLVAALAACTTPLPQRTSLPIIHQPSPNFDARRPSLVILHHTGSNIAERSLRALTSPDRQVSAHYLVARDGRIYQLVDELARAWHAGDSAWGGLRDVNSASIGIEIDNDGVVPYTEPQLQALGALLADIKARWKIPAANFVGHGDVAPARKVDPSENFPWRRLAAAGYGLWCDPPYRETAPAGVEDAVLLTAFGYDAWNVEAAIAAFKRHFAPQSRGPQLNATERAMLYCLVGLRQAMRDEELPTPINGEAGERRQ
jgi:N-acetylmuramoyl-L-alanine amidase